MTHMMTTQPVLHPLKRTQRRSASAVRPRPLVVPVKVAPEASAREAGLQYHTDDSPGITRKHMSKGWSYHQPDGTPMRDAATLQRINALAIPPAWKDVWIAPEADSHLQVTGRDEKGRKQYRYHPQWRETRDATKYTQMIAFGEALPKIRARITHDLHLRGLPHDKVLAVIVRLLETTLIRVGNEEYARENGHYGLTTLQREHVTVRGGSLQFAFTGKSGVDHTITLRDPQLARIVRQIEDLPGNTLFRYLDAHGKAHPIDSADVNTYLHEITGEHFTAKDFRTWAGTVLAALALQKFEAYDTKTQAKKNILRAIEYVAERLGNTPSVCRKCYVHPDVLNAYLDGTIRDAPSAKTEVKLTDNLATLKPEEAAVLAFLRERLTRTSARNRQRAA